MIVKYINLPNVRDLMQIAFWIVIGVIAILTYKKATRTLLQPIRTEIFKQQLSAFSEILRYFIGKKESMLREDFVFDEIFYANAIGLFDDYTRHFFDVKIDVNKRPYSPEECPIAIAMEEYLKLCDGYLREDEQKNDNPPDPRIKAAIWAKYKYSIIRLPKKFSENDKLFQKLCDSPLLTTECVKLLEEYRAIVRKNVVMIGELLSECAKELPEKYPNKDIMLKATTDWIHTRFVNKFSSLEPSAKKITAYVRNYFKVDTITSAE